MAFWWEMQICLTNNQTNTLNTIKSLPIYKMYRTIYAHL